MTNTQEHIYKMNYSKLELFKLKIELQSQGFLNIMTSELDDMLEYTKNNFKTNVRENHDNIYILSV